MELGVVAVAAVRVALRSARLLIDLRKDLLALVGELFGRRLDAVVIVGGELFLRALYDLF